MIYVSIDEGAESLRLQRQSLDMARSVDIENGRLLGFRK